MKKLPFILLIAAISLAACNSTENKSGADNSAALNSISEESFINTVKTLSSDEFEGRMPFTEGETKTINYIKEQFENIGLELGNGDSFFQEVPLVETTSSPMEELVLKGKGGELRFKLLDEFVMGSRQVKESVTVNDSELVFAGFGIVAPEYNWNDYADLDVNGKTVVVMVNDPGYYDKS